MFYWVGDSKIFVEHLSTSFLSGRAIIRRPVRGTIALLNLNNFFQPNANNLWTVLGLDKIILLHDVGVT